MPHHTTSGRPLRIALSGASTKETRSRKSSNRPSIQARNFIPEAWRCPTLPDSIRRRPDKAVQAHYDCAGNMEEESDCEYCYHLRLRRNQHQRNVLSRTIADQSGQTIKLRLGRRLAALLKPRNPYPSVQSTISSKATCRRIPCIRAPGAKLIEHAKDPLQRAKDPPQNEDRGNESRSGISWPSPALTGLARAACCLTSSPAHAGECAS